MRPFARILFSATCLLSLAVLPAAYADDEDDASTNRQTTKEKRDARRNKGKEEAAPKGNFGKEMAALGEAATLLAGVQDEAGAEEVAEKICKKFAALPPILNGTDSELELLAKAQNKVNDQMERLMSASYFVSAGLQEAWTLMTDHFSRRSAQKRRRK